MKKLNQLTALWKPLVLGVRALYVTPGRRSIPFNTASPSAIYTTYSKTYLLPLNFTETITTIHSTLGL